VEEAIALVNYYRSNQPEAEVIARAGQARTLRDHTYARRMQQTVEILERHLRYRRERNLFQAPDLSKISYGHTPIQKSGISPQMTSAWKSADIPARQRALVQQELIQMMHGNPPTVYQVLAEVLQPLVVDGIQILEIGCSSGYYYEVLEYLLNRRIAYTGVDYSEAFITMAKEYYPKATFRVADGANLPFEDNQFPIVISGCILLHVPNYPQHIAETARVAEKMIIVHRTPICRQRPTQYIKKFAYGVETVELHFNEGELLSEFEANKFKLISAIEYVRDLNGDNFEVTYLFRRSAPAGANFGIAKEKFHHKARKGHRG
jgi:SAM-dependent methyltransferase